MKPLVETIFNGPNVTIGTFRCHPEDPRFQGPGVAEAHMLVFPRTSVIIEQDGRRPVVADPNVVMLYNREQEYLRDAVSPEGDRCEWFAFSKEIVAECLQQTHPHLAERGCFDRSHAVTFPRDYMLQRALVQVLLDEGPVVEPLLVEEVALELLSRSARQLVKGEGQESVLRPSHRALARAAQQKLGTGFTERWTLSRLASELNSSPYHLARVFRRHSGRSIHAHLRQLRLRTALERVPGQGDLALLGRELGFSSHSHFSNVFRKEFGLTPSQWRRRATRSEEARLGENVSTLLTA